MGGSVIIVVLVLASLQLLLSSGLVLGWMGFLLIFKVLATHGRGRGRHSGAA